MNDYRFGNFICTLRENKGLTQRDIAEMLGVTPAAVSKWENGSSKPRVEILFRLAKILDVSPEELVEGRPLPKSTITDQSIKCINERYEYLSKIEPFSSTRIKIKRLISSLIDFIIAVILTIIFSFITNKLATVRGADEATEATVFIVVSLFSSLFFLGFHDFVGFGRSIGKRIMGLILVEKRTGERATIKKRLLRNSFTAAVLLLFPAILPIDTIIMLVRGQSIGDSLSNTVVLEKEPRKEGHIANQIPNTNQNEIMEEETDVSLADIDCNQINKYSPFVKTNKKFILGLLLVVTIIIISFICLVFVYFSKYDSYTIVNTDIEKYQEDCMNWKRISDFLPALDSLNNHTDLFYSHKTQVSSRFMGFVGEGFALFVKYEDAVYNEKKAEILNSTTFLDAPVIDRYGDYQFPVTKFFYKSYDMRIISDWKYSQPNCKSFGMIGFDDENNSIVYCYYCDFDLDLIAEKDEDPETEMYEFMNDSFEWKQ